jgi:cystathionine beta-lyase/cystathionine gamma-synthase
MDLSYIINRLGEENQQYFGAVAPPIVQTSNFCYKNVGELRKAITNEKKSLIYTRGNNPTTEILCKKLAAMEGA